MTAADVLERTVPISDFNRGKSTAAFSRVEDGLPIFVMKHNAPAYVVITPEDFRRWVEMEADFELYQLAVERMSQWDGDLSKCVSLEELMAQDGITQEELDAMPEVEFE